MQDYQSVIENTIRTLQQRTESYPLNIRNDLLDAANLLSTQPGQRVMLPVERFYDWTEKVEQILAPIDPHFVWFLNRQKQTLESGVRDAVSQIKQNNW